MEPNLKISEKELKIWTDYTLEKLPSICQTDLISLTRKLDLTYDLDLQTDGGNYITFLANVVAKNYLLDYRDTGQ